MTYGSNGAAMYVVRTVGLSIDNVDMTHNDVFGDHIGAAMYLHMSSADISNSTFASNYAGRTSTNAGGGALFVDSSTLTLTRCLFYDNTVAHNQAQLSICVDIQVLIILI